MGWWQRLGLRRAPWLTLVVLAATATVNCLQLVDSDLLATLERTDAGLHGDWWRTGTSLLVQDGGVAGTISNLAFLAVLGALAEQVASRPRWLLCYLTAGLVGELVGYRWQSVGGGNSVAICGLAGLVAMAAYLELPELPRGGPPALMVWLGALLATWVLWLVIVGIVAARLALVPGKHQRHVHTFVLAATLVVGAVLCVVENIHGAALLTGVGLAALVSSRSERVRRPAGRSANSAHD